MTAILLVHGLSATNQIFDDLEKRLKRKKYIVYNPLLPGHGTVPEDLTKVSYQHLVDFLKRYIKPIIKQYKQVIVIAESFGANIALDAVAKKYIKGMIFLGTALKVRKEWLYQGIISFL
ncbi:alpha/beta fold hydrolase [Candidatus Woesearchaeota archaeon]|nr:alpha/beta fold hydrolase [Candidatus Woesearchaeota archaeon]